MSDPATLPSREDFAAAADWWREAGLDQQFADDATDWLAPPPLSEAEAAPAPPAAAAEKAAPKNEPAAAENSAPFGGDEAQWPQDLGQFASWWLNDATLEIGGTGPRVAPRGPARPALMVVIAHPEEQDRDTLLSGPQGQLLGGFLRAAGISPDAVYCAALLPRFTAAPDWPRIEAVGAGAVLAHHIGLVAPERIVFFGRNIPPLLGHGMAQEGKSLPGFNHKGRSFPYVEAQGLARMLRSAAVRRDFWQSWLDGTDG